MQEYILGGGKIRIKMDKETKNTIITAIVVIVIMLVVVPSVYLAFKWNSKWVDKLDSYCPKGESLTDYSFMRYLATENELFGIECDNKVMDFEVKFTKYNKCKEYDKWGDCNLVVEAYDEGEVIEKEK